jgi:hypothetical protein
MTFGMSMPDAGGTQKVTTAIGPTVDVWHGTFFNIGPKGAIWHGRSFNVGES